MPVKVFYYIKDRDGFASEDKTYESEEDGLYLWQHINNARKQAGVTRENFVLITTSCIQRKKAKWVDPSWPVVPFPKLKKAKLAFGRYVIEKTPDPVDPDHE